MKDKNELENLANSILENLIDIKGNFEYSIDIFDKYQTIIIDTDLHIILYEDFFSVIFAIKKHGLDLHSIWFTNKGMSLVIKSD